MKWTLAILSFLVLFSGSAIAELTPKDLEAIRNIVDDRITESEKRTNLRLTELEKRTDLKLDKVQAEINGLRWGIGLVALFVIGHVALIIYVLNQTSKEVEKVRGYCDNIVEVLNNATDIIRDYRGNLRDIKEALDGLAKSNEALQQLIDTFI